MKQLTEIIPGKTIVYHNNRLFYPDAVCAVAINIFPDKIPRVAIRQLPNTSIPPKLRAAMSGTAGAFLVYVPMAECLDATAYGYNNINSSKHKNNMDSADLPVGEFQTYRNMACDLIIKIRESMESIPAMKFSIFRLYIPVSTDTQTNITGIKIFPDNSLRLLVRKESEYAWFKIKKKQSEFPNSYSRVDILLQIYNELSISKDKESSWRPNEHAIVFGCDTLS